MNIRDLKGLKFPDEYIIRFIYKEGLDKRKGKIVELGSGNGSNLVPFFHYGWDVVGIDYLPQVIEWGNHNFNLIKEELKAKNTFAFYKQDMIKYIASYKGKKAEVLLMPGAIYYLEYKKMCAVLESLKTKKIVGSGSYLYLRMRTKQDYRYNRGKKINEHTFKLNIKETGEYGSIMTFLDEHELVGLLKSIFTFESFNIFRQDFDNVQNGYRISNHDLVLWGRLK